MSWTEENGFLTKEFEFENFIQAIDFVKEIVEPAERMNHHPDIFIHSYKKVKISLMTHDQGKITEKDHKLAETIDQLLDK